MSKWCIDPNAEVEPDQTYDEEGALDEPLGPDTDSGSQSDAIDTLYGAPGTGDDPLGEYGQDYEDLPPPPIALPVDSFEQAESSYNKYDILIWILSSILDQHFKHNFHLYCQAGLIIS